jgi:hypothetical protein
VIDYRHRGDRVATLTNLVTFSQKLRKGQCGTVLYEFDNGIGRMLVEVDWNDIGQYPVFREEIIFLDEPQLQG